MVLYQGTTFSRAGTRAEILGALALANRQLQGLKPKLVPFACGTAEAMP
jgi:hypothetical protein